MRVVIKRAETNRAKVKVKAKVKARKRKGWQPKLRLGLGRVVEQVKALRQSQKVRAVALARGNKEPLMADSMDLNFCLKKTCA